MEKLLDIRVQRIARDGCLPQLPAYQTAAAAAMDIHAFLPAPLTLAPGARALVPTGLRLQLPPGYAALLLARSGLAARDGIALANGVGLIDSDYRGELCVALQNNSDAAFVIEDGMRVAQLLLTPVPRICLSEGDLDDTARGSGGFGSTGGAR